MELFDLLCNKPEDLNVAHKNMKIIMKMCDISTANTDFCYVLSNLNLYDLIPTNALIIACEYYKRIKGKKDSDNQCTIYLICALIANTYINDESIILFDIYNTIVRLHKPLITHNIHREWDFLKQFSSYDDFLQKNWDCVIEMDYDMRIQEVTVTQLYDAFSRHLVAA
jgi:hypothetical protein